MGKGELTRQAILDRAVQIASRVGLGGLTIGSLAAEAGMSKSGLFAHFRSKEALQIHVLDHARERFVERVLRPALAAPRGVPRLRKLFECWVGSSGDANGCLFVAAAVEFDDQEGPVHDRLVAHHRDWIESLAQMCRTGIAEGHFRDDVDPEQFAQDFYGLMLGYYHFHRLLRDPQARKRTERAFEALLDRARVPHLDVSSARCAQPRDSVTASGAALLKPQ